MAKLQKTSTEIKYDKFLKKMLADKKKLASKKKNPKRKPKSRAYETVAELKSLTYKGFLKSKYWALVRKRVLMRDKYECVVCKSNTSLQVHHEHYRNHFKELSHLSDLMTLCAKCHQEHHNAQP